MRFAWAAGLIGVALCSAAHAQQPVLIWQAPAACPAREAWLGALRARVDPAAWNEAAPKLRASVRIEATATGYAVQLDTELDGARGERRIEAASCRELVEASALIVALAIDPEAASREVSAAPIAAAEEPQRAPEPAAVEAEPAAPPRAADAPQPAPAEPAPAEPAPSPVPTPEPEPESDEPSQSPARPSRTHVFVRPLVLIDGGTLPDLALGPSLQAGLRIDRLGIELGVSYLLAQSLSEPNTSRVVGELRWLTGSLGACYSVLPAGRFELEPCARFELGRLWGRGRNLEQDMFSGGATWLAALPGVRLGFELITGLSLALELAVGLPLLPAAFTVGGVGEVHETPRVVGRLAAGFTLRF